MTVCMTAGMTECKANPKLTTSAGGQACAIRPTARRFEWDAANEDKLAERGIKPHEVEGVWSNNPDYRRNKKAGSALWMMTGADPVSGKKLKVGIIWADEGERVLRAIHALDLSVKK
jgi:hypothetical protein